jgi:hypothetical protein
MLDFLTRFDVDLCQANATALAHLASALGECLRLPTGLRGALLGLPGTLHCLACAPRPDVD